MKKLYLATFLGILSIYAFSQIEQNENNIEFKDVFAIYLEQANTQISDALATDYAKDYHNDLYNKYEKDEFEWHDQLIKIKEEILNSIHSVNINGKYVVPFKISFNQYDFEKNGFPITIEEYTNISFYSKGDGFDSTLHGVRVFFKDFPKYNFFPIKSDDGNKLLKSKKDENGNFDRTLTLLIHFTFLPMNSDEFNSAIRFNSTNEGPLLVGVISKIDVFDKNIKIGELQNNPMLSSGDEG